jgi:hypothetical protein
MVTAGGHWQPVTSGGGFTSHTAINGRRQLQIA